MKNHPDLIKRIKEQEKKVDFLEYFVNAAHCDSDTKKDYQLEKAYLNELKKCLK